jgi:DNA polymerase-4
VEGREPIEVPWGDEAAFLAPHPIDVLPAVPADIRVRLDEYQLERIGLVAAIAESELCAVFGSRGRLLKAEALGLDARPVLPPAVRAEFRISHTFATDTNDQDVLHALLRRLTGTLGARLRRRGLAARRLTVEAEYADYERTARGLALPALALDTELGQAARRALGLAAGRRVAIRTVSVTVDRLIEANVQLDLWDDPKTDPPAVLQTALDHIHRRWGARAVTLGAPPRPSADSGATAAPRKDPRCP